MRLTPSMLNKAMKLHPSGTGQRLILDPRGIHHKTMPASNFAQTVANHAEVRKVSIAESLFIVERLAALGAISQGAVVSGQGAVFQSFHGTKGYEGCHSMPCQLMVNGLFPHQLRDSNGHTFNTTFLHRTIHMFARCTWQPKIVNGVDQMLDWHPDVDFKELYLRAVRAVLTQTKAEDVYREYARMKTQKLRELLECTRDEPLNEWDVLMWAGAVTPAPNAEPSYTADEVERLLTDKALLSQFQQQRETVVEVYEERDRIIPHTVVVGELKKQVQSETWSSP